jgi:hypothetical protein
MGISSGTWLCKLRSATEICKQDLYESECLSVTPLSTRRLVHKSNTADTAGAIHTVSRMSGAFAQSVNHESMADMNWSSILSVAKQLGTAVLLVGVIAILIFGQMAQTKRRIAEYKKTGRFVDLLKIFSRW